MCGGCNSDGCLTSVIHWVLQMLVPVLVGILLIFSSATTVICGIIVALDSPEP